jgi:hypothetical protein
LANEDPLKFQRISLLKSEGISSFEISPSHGLKVELVQGRLPASRPSRQKQIPSSSGKLLEEHQKWLEEVSRQTW